MSSNNHTIVAKKITNELINIISGRNEKSLFGNKPSSVAMLGMLKGQTEDRMFDDDEYSIKNIPSFFSHFFTCAAKAAISFAKYVHLLFWVYIAKSYQSALYH